MSYLINYLFPPKTSSPYLVATDLDILPDDVLSEIFKCLSLNDLIACRAISVRYCRIIDQNFPELPQLFAIVQISKNCLAGTMTPSGTYTRGESRTGEEPINFCTGVTLMLVPSKKTSLIQYENLSPWAMLMKASPVLLTSVCSGIYHRDVRFFEKKVNKFLNEKGCLNFEVHFEADKTMSMRKIKSIASHRRSPLFDILIPRLPALEDSQQAHMVKKFMGPDWDKKLQ